MTRLDDTATLVKEARRKCRDCKRCKRGHQFGTGKVEDRRITGCIEHVQWLDCPDCTLYKNLADEMERLKRVVGCQPIVGELEEKIERQTDLLCVENDRLRARVERLGKDNKFLCEQTKKLEKREKWYSGAVLEMRGYIADTLEKAPQEEEDEGRENHRTDCSGG